MFGIYARNVISGQGRYTPDRTDYIPSISLSKCDFDKSRKVLKMSSEYFGMPSKFKVVSHHTGKEILFTAVRDGDPLCDQDGWDGEMCIYRPVHDIPNVDHLIIYHAY
jgi:hypothetical protein